MTEPTKALIRFVGDDWTLPFIYTDKLFTPIALTKKTPLVFLTGPNGGNIYELNIDNKGITLLDQLVPETKGRFIVNVARSVTQTFIPNHEVPTGPYIGDLNPNVAKLRVVMEDLEGRRKTFTTISIVCKEI